MSFNEWKIIKLIDLSEKIGSGATPRGGSNVYLETGIPFIRSQNVYNCEFHEGGLVYIDEESAGKLDNVKLCKNDIILNITGDSVARCTILPEKYIGGRVNQHVAIIRANSKILNPQFLKYFLVSSSMQAHMLSLARMGATRAALTKGMIESFEIPTPDIKEQEEIAHILSTLDDKIEVNNQINKTLENMAQAIFKQWFVDFEFPNEDGEPYKSSGGEMVESELGLIPKGWEVKKVEQVTKIIRGASPRPIQDFIRDEGIPWVKISDASSSNTRFISSTKEFIKEEGRKKSREVKVGTLILSNSATPGIPMIMKIDACVHDGWLIFDEFREVTKEFMFHFLTENRIGILSLSNGSVFRNLKTDILKNYKIIIPSRDVVARVDNIFKSINNSIDNIENQITTLTKIRDGLLTKLMSGEIRVPLDEEGDVS